MPRLAALLVVALAILATSQPDGVSVATDAPSYAPGDPLTATVTNGTADPIAPIGGIVCQGSPWPFALQQQDDAGNWQDIETPRTPPCVGIAVAQLGPGQSQSKSFAASPDPGTYRLVYPYRTPDGTNSVAFSDPFQVEAPSS
jgi:hypothetical protein